MTTLPNVDRWSQRLFNILETHANAKTRCPTNDMLKRVGIPTPITCASLARAGFVEVEIYAHNWRVIEIRFGQNKCKRTKESPIKGRPYKVIP